MAHETDYNMGSSTIASSMDETGNNPSSSRINFGYVDMIGKFFDIMAWRSSCGSGRTRTLFQHALEEISEHSGRALGIARYIPGAADAAQTLRATFKTVSHYR